MRNDKLCYLTGFIETTLLEAVDPEHGQWKPVGDPFRLPERALGVNLRWGLAPDRMHHTWQTFGEEELLLPSLDAGERYSAALESFGRGGVSPITSPIHF